MLAAPGVTGCRGPSTKEGQPARTVVIRRHPPIVQGRTEVGPFVRAGCKDKDTYLDCADVAAIRGLGCDLLRLEPHLAALGRRIPLAACLEESTHAHPWRLPGPGVREVGCMERTRHHYVIARDGKFVLLSTPEAFRAAYAPIRTPAEAAGVVLASKDVSAVYEPSKEYEARVDQIDDAHAEAISGGFRVHLFETRSCTCAAHPRYEVDYLVSPSAVVSVGEKKLIDEIPAGRVCID
jgi:hypothetical protein